LRENRDADATLPTLDIGARSRPKGGCRALDIHIVLAERAGEVAGKADSLRVFGHQQTRSLYATPPTGSAPSAPIVSPAVDDPIEAVARCSP